MAPTEFENHQVFEKLDQISSRIEEKELRKLIGVDSINFFETAISYLKDRLKLTISTIVQEAELTTISKEIENSLTQINAFVGDKNTGHITNATNHLYTATSRGRNLPLPFLENDFDFSKNGFDFSKNIAKFEKITKEKYDQLETENKELKKQFDALSKKLKETDEALENVNKTLEEKELKIKDLNESFQTNFETIKTSATQNYEQDRKTFRAEFEKSKKALAKEVEDLKSEINTGTGQIIKDLEAKLEEAKKIVGVVSDKAVTGNYQKVANSHKTTADVFRVIAIILMICLSGILIYTIWDISGENFDWTKSLIRILAAAALSYPATYAARESSKHRKLEVLNRKAELELTAINPFIELLPETQKQTIKEKLVEKYFGNSGNLMNDLEDKKEEDVSLSSIERIIKMLLPVIKK
jgi:cell division septum initiation protein DivIVA